MNAVVYDFCEEEAVRAGAFRGEDRVVHHTLLGEDVYNIEYVHRLPAISAERLAIVAPSDQARRAGRGPRPGARHRRLRSAPRVRGHRLRTAREPPPAPAAPSRGEADGMIRSARPPRGLPPRPRRAGRGTPWKGTRMTRINLQFTLFSAFYSPLIATMAGGFLREEGLEPEWSVSPPGVSALAALEDGSAHVVQSALSQGFGPLERGETPATTHFAQVNEMDGFFLTAREPEPGFSWSRLEGADVVLFGGGQPLAMFKYACHRAGIDYSRINAIHPGGAAAIDEAFREGRGAYVQQQGPFPQQLEADGIGHVVAEVGPVIGPCGFSSLAAMPGWLETDMAAAFVRAYRKTPALPPRSPRRGGRGRRAIVLPAIDREVLARCIETYQGLGCWTPHIEITHEAFEATLDIFAYNGLVTKRHPYESVCTLPLAG